MATWSLQALRGQGRVKAPQGAQREFGADHTKLIGHAGSCRAYGMKAELTLLRQGLASGAGHFSRASKAFATPVFTLF